MAFDEASSNISQVVDTVANNGAVTIFRFATVNSTAGLLRFPQAVSEPLLGIVAETVVEADAANQVVPVAISGVGMIELSATLAAGVMVSSATDGRAAAEGTTAGDFSCGPLITGGDAGDIVSIMINITQA